jgi:hypothetical protein
MIACHTYRWQMALARKRRIKLAEALLFVGVTALALVSFVCSYKQEPEWQAASSMRLRCGSFHQGGNPSQTLPTNSKAVMDESDNTKATMADSTTEPSLYKRPSKTRRASDLIVELIERSGLDDDDIESRELRMLISQRTSDYVNELQGDQKIPDPRKLLHYLAPKIPVIKHSPDVALRIQAAASDLDCGVAACLIGTLGHVCELYDQQTATRKNDQDVQHQHPTAAEMVKDRRFEQLVECVLCGVDVIKLSDKGESNSDLKVEHIKEVLDAENPRVGDGLSIRDACRAAWGIAVLANHAHVSIGDVNVLDLLVALSMRVRNMLLGRVRLLRQDDLFKDELFTIEASLDDFSEELAEDAASALWTFACVTACTGTTFHVLFDVCASILCQNPFEMRRRAQDIVATTAVGSNDAVERLARSEIASTANSGQGKVVTEGVFGSPQQISRNPLPGRRDILLDWLSPNEITDMLWATAFHGKNQTSPTDTVNLSRTVELLCKIAFDRTVTWLRKDLDKLKNDHHRPNSDGRSPSMDEAALVLAPDTYQCEEAVTFEGASRQSDKAELGVKGESNPPSDPGLLADAVDYSTMRFSKVVESDIPQSETTRHTPSTTAQSDRDDARTRKAQEAEGSGQVKDQISQRKSPDSVDEKHCIEIREECERIIPSSRDLCCLAWAVTELHDPLRSVVAELVTNIFFCLGPDSLKGLTGSDLSNLSWAIAKYKLGHLDLADAFLSTDVVVGWIVDNALDYTSLAHSYRPSDIVLQRFHPHELGRLVWSIATALPDRRDVSASIEALAHHSLTTAAAKLPVFGTEDLVRFRIR